MCDQPFQGRFFDPEFCPLLKGLSADERRRRMAEDPVICQCKGAIEGARAASRETAKIIAAYERQRAKCAMGAGDAGFQSAG
jgi:hypothetical protein